MTSDNDRYQKNLREELDGAALYSDLMRNKSAALDTLAREELGIDPAELGGNPWRAGAFSFATFSVGASFPVVPFFFSGGAIGTASSLALSVAALAVIGFATSLFSGRGPLYSIVRQVVIGAAAAAVTYGTGALIGVSIA
jgi:vacuolar iron transporter family protein